MRSDRKTLLGVVLITVTIVATLWLAATSQLVLYIHPRYVVFTVVMAAIGLVFVIAWFAQFTMIGSDERSPVHTDAPDAGGSQHGHMARIDSPTGTTGGSRGALRRAGVVAASALVVAVAGSLLVLPPATLSASTAAQRDINGGGLRADATSVAEAAAASDAAFAEFTVGDWSSLLRQTSDTQFFSGKPADVVGFVTADPDSSPDVFYVSRFIVTCCAVDAQPVGVPVYLENWQETYAADEWVEVDGGFDTNPSTASSQPIALIPDSVTVVEAPAEPYLY